MIELSAILTTYNRAHLLDEVMQSVLAQTVAPERFEVVVIDDGSTDATQAIIHSYHKRLPIRYHYQANAGLAAARNHGLAVASAPIILFMDDDDTIEAQTFAAHIESHRNYPQDEVAVLGYTGLDERIADDVLMHFATEVHGYLFWYRNLTQDSQLTFDHFWGGRTSCKRSFVLRAGGFNPVFKFGCEDIELGYRLARNGLRVVYNPSARSKMIRAISFEQFCNRLRQQGASQYVFSRLFLDAEVQRWCEMDSFYRDWEDVAPRLEEAVDRAKKLDNWVRQSAALGVPVDKDVVPILYRAYSDAFKACKLSGIAQMREAWLGAQPQPEVATARDTAIGALNHRHTIATQRDTRNIEANVKTIQLWKQLYYRSLYGKTYAAKRAEKVISRLYPHCDFAVRHQQGSRLTSRSWLAKELLRRVIAIGASRGETQ